MLRATHVCIRTVQYYGGYTTQNTCNARTFPVPVSFRRPSACWAPPLGNAVSASIGAVAGETVYHTGRSSGNIEGALYKDSAGNLYSQVWFLSRLNDLCGTYHSNSGNGLMLFHFAQLSLSSVSLHNLAAVEERIKA